MAKGVQEKTIMIVEDSFDQNSDEWWNAHLGIPSASQFDRIVTAVQCKPSASQRDYAFEKAAEKITGIFGDKFASLATFNGHAMESESLCTYQLITGNRIHRVGVIYRDDGKKYLASPDGLITNSAGEYIGGVEAKNVCSKVQVKYLYNGGVPTEYKGQVYASLYISQLPTWDFISCSPGLPPHLVRVNADDKDYRKYADVLDSELPRFLELLDDIIETVRNK